MPPSMDIQNIKAISFLRPKMDVLRRAPRRLLIKAKITRMKQKVKQTTARIWLRSAIKQEAPNIPMWRSLYPTMLPGTDTPSIKAISFPRLKMVVQRQCQLPILHNKETPDNLASFRGK